MRHRSDQRIEWNEAVQRPFARKYVRVQDSHQPAFSVSSLSFASLTFSFSTREFSPMSSLSRISLERRPRALG